MLQDDDTIKLSQDFIEENPNAHSSKIIASLLGIIEQQKDDFKYFDRKYNYDIQSLFYENNQFKEALIQARLNWNSVFAEADDSEQIFYGLKNLEGLREILKKEDIDLETHNRALIANTLNTFAMSTVNDLDIKIRYDIAESAVKIRDGAPFEEVFGEDLAGLKEYLTGEKRVVFKSCRTLNDHRWLSNNNQFECVYCKKTVKSLPSVSTVIERKNDLRTQKLIYLIEVLIDILNENDGSISYTEAVHLTAKKAEVPVAVIPYVINSAVADNRITSNLRTGVIRLVSTS